MKTPESVLRPTREQLNKAGALDELEARYRGRGNG